MTIDEILVRLFERRGLVGAYPDFFKKDKGDVYGSQGLKNCCRSKPAKLFSSKCAQMARAKSGAQRRSHAK